MAAVNQNVINRFDGEQGLVDVLHELGVGKNERDRIVDDGFDSMRSIVNQYENDPEGMRGYLKQLNKAFGSSPDDDLRIYFSPPVMSRMIGLLHYSNVCFYSYHVIPDMNEVTIPLAMEYYKTYQGLKELVAQESDADLDITVPNFKGASNWRSFRDLVTMKLGLIKGQAGYPLDYVVNSSERIAKRGNATRRTVDHRDITRESFKTSCVHFGKAFKEDNRRVWNVLKSLLLENSAYNHILEMDRTSNGREAWNVLKRFYEGEDFKQRLQDEAFSILSSTGYRGESARFNFESYVNRHLKAHKLLLEADYNNSQGMDESTKIQHLKSGIRLEAGLETAITTARTAGILRGSFQEFVSFLSAEVNQREARKKELKGNPRVNKVTTRNSGNNRRDKRNRSKEGSDMVDGMKIEARYYPSDEWRSLTRKQKTAIIKLKRRSKNSNDKNMNATDANISALQKTLRDELITVGDAIIAGMRKGKSETPDEIDVVETTSACSSPSKRSAKAGSVGEFLAKRRK